MKIVILSDDFPPTSFGGAGIIAANLSRALAEKGNSVWVVTVTQKKEEEGQFQDGNFIVHKIYTDYPERWRAYRSIYNFQAVTKIKKILSIIKPDVVHAHNIHQYLSYASLKVAAKYSRAVFLTAHDAMVTQYGKVGVNISSSGQVFPEIRNAWQQFKDHRWRYNPFRNFLIVRYLKYVSKVFSVSVALKDILEKGGIQDIEVMHNGIDTSSWVTERVKVENFKNKYNLNNKKVLFFAGRLSSAKGGNVIFDILKRVLQRESNTILLIAGNKGKWGEGVAKKAEQVGISQSLIFTGWIDRAEIKYAYEASDVVFTLSQYIDPFPTTNLEAMASSKPVIGTMFGGTSEVVLDGVTGYIINPKNVDIITEKTLDLLTNTEKAKNFGHAGFERVKTKFTEEAWVNETLVWYANYLK